jgi:transcriptional regulator with XRE-family HTH domain
MEFGAYLGLVRAQQWPQQLVAELDVETASSPRRLNCGTVGFKAPMYVFLVDGNAGGTVPVGEFLRQARQQAGLTQEELATRAGLSVRAISDLERGLTSNPRRSSVQLLMDALGLSEPPQARPTNTLSGGLYTITPFLPGDGTGAASFPMPVMPRPAQLPADIVDFTGRADQVEQVCGLLSEEGAEGSPGAVRVVLVMGTGGLGKSTLTVHAAHLLASQFPDGQLYANLLGATQPADPAEVLARFLRDLGVDGSRIPLDKEERAAHFRTRVAGKRVLIVLDDALDAAQVQPLLPGSASAAALVTGRNRLPELMGSMVIDLDVLRAEEARALSAPSPPGNSKCFACLPSANWAQMSLGLSGCLSQRSARTYTTS